MTIMSMEEMSQAENCGMWNFVFGSLMKMWLSRCRKAEAGCSLNDVNKKRGYLPDLLLFKGWL